MTVWRYTKPLNSEKLIAGAEAQFAFKYPDSYIELIMQYNGGRPPVSVFDTKKTRERTIKSLLSFNEVDTENVYKAYKTVCEIRNDVIPFGIDSFGNYICFNKADSVVVFLDFESGEIEIITDGFSEFLTIIDPQNFKQALV
jgi:hypothetical protein